MLSPTTMPGRFAWTQAICAGIALMLAALGTRGLAAWLYSALIGAACWTLIDGGRHALARWRAARAPHPCDALRDGWPGWGWMAPVIGFGSLGGWWLGTLAGDALTGYRSALAADGDWRRLAGVLVVPLAAGVTTTWFFYTRSRIAAVEAAAAEAARQASDARLKQQE